MPGLPGSPGCVPVLLALCKLPEMVSWVPKSFLSPANPGDRSSPGASTFCHVGEGSCLRLPEKKPCGEAGLMESQLRN